MSKTEKFITFFTHLFCIPVFIWLWFVEIAFGYEHIVCIKYIKEVEDDG